MLNRLLEPPEAEFLERPPDADRAAGRVAVIGVEGEREAVADEAAPGAGLGNRGGGVAGSTGGWSGSAPIRARARAGAMIPSEASPPCIGEASPIPDIPSSVWTRTQALRCAGWSPGDQLT